MKAFLMSYQRRPSNIAKAMTSRKPVKPPPLASSARTVRNTTTPNTSAASSSSTPSISSCKRSRRALDYYSFESSVCSVSETELIPAPKKQSTTNPIIEKIIQESTQPPRQD